MECPDPDALSALLGQSLSPDDRFRMAVHASACDACSAALEALRDTTGRCRAMCGLEVDDAASSPWTIGRYVINGVLGVGGMGVVYRALDPALNRMVALKVLHRDADLPRLKREAHALAKLDHPNVVAIYDVGTEREMFIVMEYVQGDNLRQWLAREPRSARRVLEVVVDAGRGLVAMHALGLIHRDLKPDNIFVSDAGQVHVGDLGLVRGSDSAERGSARGDGAITPLTQSSIVGTPAYMPPEQHRSQVSAASDQFSFCVTAWEALTGQRPFRGTALSEIHDNVRCEEVIAPPRGHALPRRVEAALRRGLAAHPAERFASMEELLRAIDPRTPVRWQLAAAVAAATAAVAVALVLTLVVVAVSHPTAEPEQRLLPWVADRRDLEPDISSRAGARGRGRCAIVKGNAGHIIGICRYTAGRACESSDSMTPLRVAPSRDVEKSVRERRTSSSLERGERPKTRASTNRLSQTTGLSVRLP